MKNSSRYSANFDQSLELLLKLHELEVAGKFESLEADAVRDLMDAPWYRLTRDETDLLKGLSADLNSLLPDWPFELRDMDSGTLDPELQDSIRDRNWLRALNCVRKSVNLSLFSQNQWRAICWLELDQPRVALFFLQYNLRQPSLHGHFFRLYFKACSAALEYEAAQQALDSGKIIDPLIFKAFQFVLSTEKSLLKPHEVRIAEIAKSNEFAIDALRDLETQINLLPFDSLERIGYLMDWKMVKLNLAKNYMMQELYSLAIEEAKSVLGKYPNDFVAAQILTYSEEAIQSSAHPSGEPELQRQLKASRDLFLHQLYPPVSNYNALVPASTMN